MPTPETKTIRDESEQINIESLIKISSDFSPETLTEFISKYLYLLNLKTDSEIANRIKKLKLDNFKAKLYDDISRLASATGVKKTIKTIEAEISQDENVKKLEEEILQEQTVISKLKNVILAMEVKKSLMDMALRDKLKEFAIQKN